MLLCSIEASLISAKKTSRFAFAALVAGAAALMTTTSHAGPRYDGLWSVLVVTEKGDCDPGYRYPIRIENGKLPTPAIMPSPSPARWRRPAPSP